VRQVTAQLLRVRGYSVLEARDERETLQIGEAHEGPIQVLILDTTLCRHNGWQLVRNLLCMRPGLRVLYLSSGYEYPAGETTPACPAACLAKPFAADALLAKVRDLLTARSA
jgi:DNA-binding response OmpR family regulator